MSYRKLLVAVLAIVAGTACGSSPTSATPMPTTPSPLPGGAVALPLGQAVGADVPCPSGSPAGAGTCMNIAVSCPSAPASALIRVDRPAVAERGTLLLVTDGDGTLFARARPFSRLMDDLIDTLSAQGVTTIEVAWRPGLWGGPQARTRACGFATAARWIYDNLHRGGGSTLFAAQGRGEGASQIAFALAHYGMGEYLDLANLASGPVACPLCGADTGVEPLLPATGSPSREPLLAYPRTTVRFFLGDAEPSSQVRAEAQAYFDAVRSGKGFAVVPGTAHEVEQSEAGVAALVGAVLGALR